MSFQHSKWLVCHDCGGEEELLCEMCGCCEDCCECEDDDDDDDDSEEEG